ncbi:MAG TPA: hypothetical protein VK585_13415 [Jiangellaceae bacterium]|nr:hypothetical protein [Jiangellaceae bacterium]
MGEVAGQLAVVVGLGEEALAFCSKVATASAPAAKRSGGSSWPASWTSAWASLAGSLVCWPFMLFQVATVCLVRTALSSIVDWRSASIPR